MSWNSLDSRDFLNGIPSHQLSATRLLSTPDPARHQVEDGPDFYPFTDEGPVRESMEELRNGMRWGSRFGPDHRPTGRVTAASILDCFTICRSRIDQYFARRKIERGVRLYGSNEQRLAVKIWLSALKTIKNRSDKFSLLGHLYQAYMDFGKYRESLEFAHRQLGISEELDSAPMRGEAYLNLARAHQMLGTLDRAMSYGRHAMYNDCGGATFAGNVHLTVASVHLEIGHFSRAMDGFQKALNVAQSNNDNTLLLQVYVALSQLWCRLRDVERGVACAARACDLGRGPRAADLNTRHHRRALVQMASALRSRGELGDAHDYCNEALRLAAVAGDQGCYARAVRIAGDVYRRKCDIGKALRHYEVAMGAGQALGDRLAQMEAMDGAARCLEALRLQGRICNCRPLEFNTRLLEVASSVRSKMLVRRLRLRLADIYTALGDNAAAKRQKDAVLKSPLPECARCMEPIGDQPEPLSALPCAHIAHQACMPESWSRRSFRGAGAECAECLRRPRPAPPPPAPPAPRTLPSQEFPFGTPPILRDSDSLLSDPSSQQATSSIERGVRLYGSNEQRLAVKIWLSALKTIKNRSDKFSLLGHLYQAYMDFGKYRESLEFAHRQLGISEELDSAPMRGEAYLNLARAHQMLGTLDRAMSYGRHAMYNDCGGATFAGNVHLTVASVHLEIGHFSRAMDGFQKALNVAQSNNDNTLLLQVYVALSQLWCRLRDVERGVACAARACDLGRGPRAADLNTRHHRRALVQMASALRSRGELGDAHDYCNEALRLAAVAGDQGCYARAVRIAGDVYRRKCDIGKALRHYEVAMGAGQALGDRLAQMEAMDGAARCLEALRLQGRICNCRPLEFNTRLLEVASSVRSKMLVRRLRLRLADIYTALGDNAAAKRQKDAVLKSPLPECARCMEPIGDQPEPLSALPCAHIAHQACMPESWSRRSFRGAGAECAECLRRPRPAPPPPAPPAPRTLPSQEFPFGTPPILRDSDSLLSDPSSQQATSSV